MGWRDRLELERDNCAAMNVAMQQASMPHGDYQQGSCDAG